MSRRHVEVPRERFVAAIAEVHADGEYPSGSRINAKLRRGGRYLAPVECQWRREVCDLLGITLNGRNLNGKPGRRRPPMRINGSTTYGG